MNVIFGKTTNITWLFYQIWFFEHTHYIAIPLIFNIFNFGITFAYHIMRRMLFLCLLKEIDIIHRQKEYWLEKDILLHSSMIAF